MSQYSTVPKYPGDGGSASEVTIRSLSVPLPSLDRRAATGSTCLDSGPLGHPSLREVSKEPITRRVTPASSGSRQSLFRIQERAIG
jgi:hypothetical protein